LGDIFSDAYYVLYDYQSQTLGFNGYVLENLPILKEKSEKPEPGFPIWLVIILALLGMSIITCLCIFYVMKRKNTRLRSLLNEYNDQDDEEEEDDEDETGEKSKKKGKQE
jgi:hypothetical protein